MSETIQNQVRLTPEQRALIEAAAARAGYLSTGEFIRVAAVQRARAELGPDYQPVERDPEPEESPAPAEARRG